MTDQELRKLRRQELLEILFSMRKELDAVKSENERLRKQIEDNESGELIRLVRETAVRIDDLCRAQGIEVENVKKQETNDIDHIDHEETEHRSDGD